MKKLLALVLAMVMTLGLSAVSANAVDKFADADSIKYTEAATVMKAIGVFDGDDSGNFRPTETLKRSEAAKIVAYLMLTKKTADGLVPSGTRYVDVPANHWAAGYIEYLTSEGVLGGVGDGKFNPDGDITGIDFAKMLLVALGYDAKLENLVLSDYRINTAKLANSIDLFEGNTDMVPTAAITRDEAVLYAFNMIKSPMVEYDSNVRVDSGNGSVVTVGNNRAYEKTSNNNSKQTISYKQAARNAQYSTNAPWIVEFAEEKYPDLKLSDVSVVNEKGIGADAFGRPSRKWLWKNEDLGRFVMTQDLVTTWNKKVTAKMLYDQLGKTIYDSLKDRNSELDSWVDGMQIIDDNYYEGTTTLVNVGDYLNRDNTTKVNGSGNGTVTELYMDKDKNVTIVTMNVFVYQAAADYNKNSKLLRITPAGETSEVLADEYGYRLYSNELKLEDFADIENYKTDDYILVKLAKTDGNNNVYEVKEIEKAEKITGKVDSYTSDGTYSVTIDGTKHDYAVTAESASNETRATMYSVGKDATIVVDKSGYIYAVDEAIVTTDYVFITKFGSGNTNLKTEAYASAYFTDGTDSTIKLKSVYNFNTGKQVTDKATIQGWSNTTTSQAGHWYTYSKNASNEYTLYAPQKGYMQYGDSFSYVSNGGDRNVVMSDGQVYFAQNGTNLKSSRADDKTVIVVHDEAKDQVNVYTGVKNVPGISLNDGSKAKIYSLDKTSDNSRVAKVVFVDLKGSALVTGSANDNLIYVVKSDGSIRSDDVKKETHWQYQVLKSDGSGEKENIIADNQLTGFTGKYYGAANYASKNSDGLYTRFYAVSDDDAQSSTIAWGQADGDDWNGGIGGAMNKANAPITYKNGALTVGGYGWTLDTDAKITVIGLYYKSNGVSYDARVINTDKDAEAEFHTWISGSELNGMFNGLTSYTYDYALRTVNNVKAASGLAASNSRTVKELYITVRNASDTGATQTVSTTGLTVDVDNSMINVYYTGTTAPSVAAQLAAVEERLDDLGYVVSSSGVLNGVYTFDTVNPYGYAEYLTFTPVSGTIVPNVVVYYDGEYVPITDTKVATYLTGYSNGEATVANGKYVSVDLGDWAAAGDKVKVGLYSSILTSDMKVAVDGADVYLKSGNTIKNLGEGGTGTGWLLKKAAGGSETYVVYKDNTALADGDVLTSGYVKVTGATETYAKYGEAKTLNVAADGKYVVTNGSERLELESENKKLSVPAVNGNITVSKLVKVTVTLNDTLGANWSATVNGTAVPAGATGVDVYGAKDESLRIVLTAGAARKTEAAETVSVTGGNFTGNAAEVTSSLNCTSLSASSVTIASGADIKAGNTITFTGKIPAADATVAIF